MAKKKRREAEYEKLARLIKGESEDIRKEMATKDDVASLYRMMATKDDIREVRRDMATKADVEDAKDEIMNTLRPIQRAVDKDALAVVNYERRLVRVETKIGLSEKK